MMTGEAIDLSREFCALYVPETLKTYFFISKTAHTRSFGLSD